MKDIHFHENRTAPSSKSHMPGDSLFYEKVVPVLLALLGLVMLALVLFAAGVALGLIRY